MPIRTIPETPVVGEGQFAKTKTPEVPRPVNPESSKMALEINDDLSQPNADPNRILEGIAQSALNPKKASSESPVSSKEPFKRLRPKGYYLWKTDDLAADYDYGPTLSENEQEALGETISLIKQDKRLARIVELAKDGSAIVKNTDGMRSLYIFDKKGQLVARVTRNVEVLSEIPTQKIFAPFADEQAPWLESIKKTANYARGLNSSAQPRIIVIGPNEDGTFRLIQGHHRLRASQLKGKDSMEAWVYLSDKEGSPIGLPSPGFGDEQQIIDRFIVASSLKVSKETAPKP